MTAAIVSDTATAVGREKHHLVFPGVSAQRPAVAEHDRLSASPILEVDARAVFRRDRVHRSPDFIGRLFRHVASHLNQCGTNAWSHSVSTARLSRSREIVTSAIFLPART